MNLIKRNKWLFIPAMILRDFFGSTFIQSNLSPEWKKSLKELRKNGVCIAPIKFEDDFITEAREKIDSHISQAQIFDSDQRLFEVEKKIKTVGEIFSYNKVLMDVARKYLHSEVLLQFTLAAKLSFKPGNLGSGQGWHRDSYSRQFKAMLYLTDVCKDSGPFEYIIGSHRYGKIIREIMHKKTNGKSISYSRFTQDDVDLIKSNLAMKSIKYEAKKGKVILFDSRGIHRGAPIRRGSRYALTNYYIKKNHAL